MNPLRRLLAAFLLVALANPAFAVAPPRDWSKVAMRKPDGAFVQGNPNAKVKLVEYLSLTCPHCAHFEAEGVAPLTAKYIRTGLVSYEVRHALRDAFDLAASMLARCNGPEAFFATVPVVYAQQEQWFARAAKWQETAPDPKGMPPEKMLPLVAEGAGLPALFAAHGLPAAKANACLTDKAELALLTTMANDAWSRPNFPGTPAFFIDGVQQDLGSWAELDKKLAATLRK